MSGTSNPASYGYANEMDRASDNYNPASAYDYRNGSDIQSDNAMAARLAGEAAYSGSGLRPNRGGTGLRFSDEALTQWNTGVNSGITDAARSTDVYLSRDQEDRLRSGQTMSDVYEPGESDGLSADATGALRRLANKLPNVKSGYFTDNFTNKALNSDVPVLQRQLYGATLPAVLLEQGGIGLINAPGRLVSAVDNLLGVFTETTTEGRIISGLTALRDGSEGLLGLAPLVPASKWNAPLGFGRTGAAIDAEIVMPGRIASNPITHETEVVDFLKNSPRYGAVGEQVHLRVTLQDGTSFKIRPDALEDLGTGAYRIHDAKFGLDGRDMINGKISFTGNQAPAFPEIANGTARVEIANSAAGRAFFGRGFEVGKPLVIDPQIKIYVNTPQGVAVRTNPFNR